MECFYLGSFGCIKEYAHIDEAGNVTVETVIDDISDILDANQVRRDGLFGFEKSDGMRPLADIDLVTVCRWKTEGVDIFNPDDEKKVRAKLREESKFVCAPTRTHAGIIIAGKR